jgi:hypothetical protein
MSWRWVQRILRENVRDTEGLLFLRQGFKASIVTELCKRSVELSLLKQQDSTNSSGSQQPLLSSLPRAVRMVAELVELEKSVMHHKEIYTQAAEELEVRVGKAPVCLPKAWS